MAMLQHYYTSCSTGFSGGVGFQCKAQSPGIQSDDLKVINNLIGYRIPLSLVDAPITQHPMALRYELLGKDKCILLCSQSNGNDENGRPGNFFAHSIITSPKDFDVFPPIMFWRHPFWILRDDSPRLELPIASAFEQVPSLDFQQVWSFLELDERKNWFSKLLSASIFYGQTKRPIIILDDVDNIALWILAITVALPQAYRQYITFATYHHDPYQVPFLITGTTTDSRFRFSSDEYISYFVLNAFENRISEIENSIYTRFVAENFTQDLYETKLLDFFELCNSRISPEKPGTMEIALSSITKFYLTVRERSLVLPDTRAHDGLRHFIKYVEGVKELSQYDLEDLISTVDLLGKQVTLTPEIDIVQDYGMALRQLKRLHPKYAGHAKEDMLFLANLALNGNEGVVKSLLTTYRDVYRAEILTNVISQPDYLSFLQKNVPINQWNVHFLIWQYILPYVRIDASTKPLLTLLLENSLSAIGEIHRQDDPDMPLPEAEKVLSAIISATNNNQKFIFEACQDYQGNLTYQSFAWLYYKLVGKVPLAERKPYRNLVRSLLQELLTYEIRRDMRERGISNIIQTLEDWLEHTNDYAQTQSLLVTQGLDAIWKMVPLERRVKTAESILSNPKILQQLDSSWKNRIISDYFSTAELQTLGLSSVKLYEQYRDWPSLSPKQRGMIGGSLAMITGEFSKKSVPDIRQFFSQLDSPSYEKEANKLIWRFFHQGVSLESHLEMLQAVYVKHHESVFWNLYWPYFKQLAIDPNRTKEFVSLLSFWFDDSLKIFSDLPYIGQSFFLELPSILKGISTEKGFQRTAHMINLEAINCSWYPLVEQYFIGSKKKSMLSFLKK